MVLVKVTIECGWKRALNAARRTIGKEPIDKEPSNQWKAKMLLAEHSPIKLVEYLIQFNDLRQWVGVHLLRHEHSLPFIHSQRSDRNESVTDRDALPQGAPNDQDFVMNAQTLINVSRKRLCMKASKETREAWQMVKDEVAKVDPIMATKMVPNCQYSNFCREFECCGYFNTLAFLKERAVYVRTDYEECWTPIKGYEGYYEISRLGEIRSLTRIVKDGEKRTKTIVGKLLKPVPNPKRRYYCEIILHKGGKRKTFKVHRLVAETFIPNPECKPEVNHKDGNKLNNHVSNLEWVTSVENKRHAWTT